MGIIFDDATDRAKKAARSGMRAKAEFKECADLLDDVSQRLLRIAKHLPKEAPSKSTKSIQKTMKQVEGSAKKTLIHMKKLDTHVRHMERSLK